MQNSKKFKIFLKWGSGFIWSKPLILVISILLVSCATITEERMTEVLIQTKDSMTGAMVSNVQCSISYNEKIISLGSTPFKALLNSRQPKYVISCVAPDYKVAKKSLPRITTKGFDKTNNSVIAFLGIGIDLISNANKKYADTVTILMERGD